MCGLAGILDARSSHVEIQGSLTAMLSRLRHRGPDDEGSWQEGPVALGHRRLSVVDLSATGHQPMASPSQRWVVAYNGEIYNHVELRAALANDGVVFRGTSDTEVLLALIERSSFGTALQACVGMFAIAAWDRSTRTLHLARDRIGEKPLYVGRAGKRLVFGSELKALMADPTMSRRADASSVYDVIAQGFVAPDRCIFEDAWQVPPGAIQRFRIENEAVIDLGIVRYWSADDAAAPSKLDNQAMSWDGAIDQLDALLKRAVAQQLQADVPVGVFLSGGVDSSLVSALAVAASTQRVRTYTIGFDDPRFNEAEHARAVARHLGTDHAEFTVGVSQARDLVPTLADLYDEPLADSSQIPMVFLSRLARRGVTVALSGDGADETFGGYPKYRAGQRLWTARARPLKAMAARSAMVATQRLQPLVPPRMGARLPSHKLHAAHSLYGAATIDELARQVGALNRQASRYLAPRLREDLESGSAQQRGPSRAHDNGYVRHAMRSDLAMFLPGDILTKVDRATMSTSLESRAPMLDHRVVEWSLGLPTSMLVNAHGGKLLLHRLLHRYVPAALVDRPKAGFVVPLAHWLRTDLRGWAYDMLRCAPAAELLDARACVRLLDQHVQGRYDFSARVWPLVTLASWAHRYLTHEFAVR